MAINNEWLLILIPSFVYLGSRAVRGRDEEREGGGGVLDGNNERGGRGGRGAGGGGKESS